MAVCELQRAGFTDVPSSIAGEVERAFTLKDRFYASLGFFPGDEEYERKLSYEPWVERASFERLVATADSIEEEFLRQRFEESSLIQLTTVLKERYNSEKNRFRYNIKDGKLYSEILATEPFENVLLRGLEYRRQEGSLELVREEKEVEGFINVVQGVLGNPVTMVGIKMVLFFPPGLIKGSDYKKRFVDISELKKDEEGNRYVESVRFSSGMDYEGYKKSAQNLDSNYFDGYQGSNVPLDAWFLLHPVVVPSDAPFERAEEIYDRFMEKDYEVMKEREFQKLLAICMPAIQYYTKELIRDSLDWRKLATSFNAIFNIGDNYLSEREEKRYREDLDKFIPRYNSYQSSYHSVYSREEMLYWGRQEVRTVAGGCPGVSSGFKIRYGFGSGEEALVNSVGKFGLSTDEVKNDPNLCRCENREPHFHCPGEKDGKPCNHPIIVGEGTTSCPSCGAGKVC